MLPNVHVQTTPFVPENEESYTLHSHPKGAQKGQPSPHSHWIKKGRAWPSPLVSKRSLEEAQMLCYHCIFILSHLLCYCSTSSCCLIWKAQMLRYCSTSSPSSVWEPVLKSSQNGRRRSQKGKDSTLHHNHLCYWSAIQWKPFEYEYFLNYGAFFRILWLPMHWIHIFLEL